MMWGYGSGWGWMMLMPLVWLAFIGLVVWAVVRLSSRDDGQRDRRATPQEILDLRYARGEIDAEAYTRARAQLAGREPSARAEG